MLFRLHHRFRIGLVTASVVGLLVVSTGSVLAEATPAPGGDATFTQDGRSADAWSGVCSPNGDGTSTCSGQGLSIFVGKMSDSLSGLTHVNQACVSIETYTIDDATGEIVGDYLFESGCTVDLPSRAIQSSKKLTSVALARTTLTIGEQVCDHDSCEIVSERPVTVEGTWTASGPTFSSRYRSLYDDGTCRYAERSTRKWREATFAGTIDGATLPETYATIADGKSKFRSRCDEV